MNSIYIKKESMRVPSSSKDDIIRARIQASKFNNLKKCCPEKQVYESDKHPGIKTNTSSYIQKACIYNKKKVNLYDESGKLNTQRYYHDKLAYLNRNPCNQDNKCVHPKNSVERLKKKLMKDSVYNSVGAKMGKLNYEINHKGKDYCDKCS